MKNLKKILAILGILFLGLFGIMQADEIPEFSHRYKRCVKIEDINIVSGYKLIVWRDIFEYGSTYYDVYEIIENECLPQHRQGGSTRSQDVPYLVDENLNINLLNGLSSEDFEKKIGHFVKLERINPNGGWITNDSKKTYENITYKLVNNNGNYSLEISNIDSDEISTGNGNITTNKNTMTNEINNTLSNYIQENYFYQFLKSRLTTIILETIALFFLYKLFFKKDNLKTGRIILTGILASSITLPILRFVLPHIFHNYTVYAIFGEIFVTFVEVFIIKYLLDINRQKATIASIACNLFSVIIGLLL